MCNRRLGYSCNQGAGIYIKHTTGRSETVSMPTGKHCTNYRAEVEAILQAAITIEDSQECCPKVVIFTNALSALQALGNSKLPMMSRALDNLRKNREVSLQWIPAHCGITGNEAADKMAKTGAKGEQHETATTYEEGKTVIKTLARPKTAKDDYYKLNRWKQVMIFSLRTGHTRLNAHMHAKFKLSPSPLCPCGLETKLQRCPRLEQTRKKLWPDDTMLQTKLYGEMEDPKRTAYFIAGSGMTV